MLNIEKKDAKNIQEVLRRGQKDQFWKIICQALDDSIEHLQKEQDDEDIKDLPAEYYKLENELLKAKRKFLKHLKDIPNSLIAWFEEPAGNKEKEENFDPFYTSEELKKEL